MDPRISFITLGVSNLKKSIAFYTDVLKLPQLKSPPEVAFFEMGKTWLSLFSRESLAADAGVSPQGAGFPGFTISHNVKNEKDVDALLKEISDRGGKIIKPAQKADWGGRIGYFADPDGYLWEVAWNPHFPHV